jgi:hypothetical protein
MRRWAVYTAILFASWNFNLLGLPDPDRFERCRWRSGFLGCEANLPVSRAVYAGPCVHPLFPLVHKKFDQTDWQYYRSQFGLSGVVLGGLKAVLPVRTSDLLVWSAAVCALLTAAAVGLVFAAAARWLPVAAADIACGLAACSPVLLPFAPSLYLGTVLHFAPFALVWCLYPRAVTPRQKTRLVLGVSLLVGVKALCGYEYITTVLLAPLAAAWFHQHRAGESWRQRAAVAANLLAAGVLGVAVAVAVHYVQMRVVIDEDAVAVIRERAAERIAAGLEPDPWDESPGRFGYVTGRFLGYFDRCAVSGPGFFGRARPQLPLKAVLGLAAGWVFWNRTRRRLTPDAAALAGACAIGFAAGLSWQVLAVNHMCKHPHLNMVVFAVPFLPLAFLLMGLAAARAGAGRCVGRGVLAAVVAVMALNAGLSIAREHSEAAARERAVKAVAGLLAGPGTATSDRVHGHVCVVETVRDLDRYAVLGVNELDLNSDRPYDPHAVLIRGWATAGAGDGPHARTDLVVVCGGRPVLPRVQRAPRADIDKLAGKHTPEAGYIAVVPSAVAVPGERPRVFAVARDDPTAVTELKYADSEK